MKRLYHPRRPCNEALIYIAQNGDVFPCSLISSPIGNISASSISKIWRSDAAEEFRANSKYTCCINSECTLRSLCGGMCRA